MLYMSNIKKIDFPESQYYKAEFAKKQIVLHHTASGKGIDGDWRSWLTTPERIATAFIIDRDGTVNQLYGSKYWGHHLGVKSDFLKSKGFTDFGSRNELLNKQSIAIEIDAWGGLKKLGNDYITYAGAKIPINEVVDLGKPFRGYQYYQCYSKEQIVAVKDLLQYLAGAYKIPTNYQTDMWDVSKTALSGMSGIFTHVSYRSDKSDCFPQPDFIEMLKNL